MLISRITTQLKREVWENRVGLLWAPLIFGGLLFAAAMWLMLNPNTITHGASKTELNLVTPGAMALTTLVYQMVMCVMYMIIFGVVIASYAHSTLFTDRKSREILFWRSMPVSETVNVLTKLMVICFVIPLIIFIATVSGGLLFVVFMGFINPDLNEVWQAIKRLSVSIDLLGSTLIVMLLLLPIISWNLFCSAFARRSPLSISVSVPLGLWILDAIAQKYFDINLLFKDALAAYAKLSSTSFKKMIGDAGRSVADIDLASSLDPTVTSITLIISALLIAATIWLRNNHYEI